MGKAQPGDPHILGRQRHLANDPFKPLSECHELR